MFLILQIDNRLHYKNVLFLILVLQLDEPSLPLIPGCTLSHFPDCFDHAFCPSSFHIH